MRCLVTRWSGTGLRSIFTLGGANRPLSSQPLARYCPLGKDDRYGRAIRLWKGVNRIVDTPEPNSTPKWRSLASGTSPESGRQSEFAPHGLALMTMWLLTMIAVGVMLSNGVRNTDQFRVERYILQVAYVAALLWYLGRTGPSFTQLPEIRPLLLQRSKIGQLIPVLGIALLLALAAFSDEGVDNLMLLLMIATIWILVVWRREIRLRPAVLGLAVAVIAFLGGLPFWHNSFVTESVFAVLLVFVPPMFIAGGLLHKRTGLGGSQLYAGRYGKALRSFVLGCLLFVPLGLINAAAGSPGTGITWVTRLWMPLWVPWFSGIAEEAWFRLFLVSLCYLLLRPAFSKRPARAVVSAVLFSAITFGLGHGRTLDRLLTTGLLYGLPMAVIFTRRDWEHAVGAHYMINMIPWVMVFLET